MNARDTRLLTRRSLLGGLAATASLPAVASASSLGATLGLHLDLPTSSVEGGVYIGANENPLGPCEEACAQLSKLIPMTGRYDRGVEKKVTDLFAQQNDLPASHVGIYAGSFLPLHYAGLAFASPTRSIVAASPTFDAMFYKPDRTPIAPMRQVPVDAQRRIDVKAMVAADGQAGIIYLCNPNNPTGTILSRDEIGYVIKNKPAGSIVIVDEAYIHYSDAETSIPFVKQGADILVSRTFSKIYGMAGLRCGVLMGRPDLLAKITPYGANPMPTPALVAAYASLQQPALIAERRRYNNGTREATFAWLKQNGYEYLPSQTNFFMLKVNRPGGQVSAALAREKVFISGARAQMEDWVRVSVGTPEEMRKFQVALQKVMSQPATAHVGELMTHDSQTWASC